MFREPRTHSMFRWEDLGDLQLGRPNLGPNVPVAVYRLLQYTLRDVLTAEYGPDESDRLIRVAGHVAGSAFYHNAIAPVVSPNEFLARIQSVLREWAIGVVRFERVDLDAGHVVVSIAEDLDCSGLPVSDETICAYDEGFLAGVLEAYTGRRFTVREIDCWASGARVCRFEARVKEA